MKNSLLCYAKDNNRYDTKDRLPTATKGATATTASFVPSLGGDWIGGDPAQQIVSAKDE